MTIRRGKNQVEHEELKNLHIGNVETTACKADEEAVMMIISAMEQVGGIYVVVADHGKAEVKKKRPPERIWVLCINFIHLEDKVVLLGWGIVILLILGK